MRTLDTSTKTAIWWGRSDTGYSRNAVVRAVMSRLGWSIHDSRPGLMDQIGISSPDKPAGAQLVWVPCFRQRDMTTAARFARRHGLPLVFDPLISAYDKQVFERHKFVEGSARARRLLAWERARFALADLVIADTQAHANYFEAELGVPAEKLAVLPVGADEAMFVPQPLPPIDQRRVRVLFFGSFIHLHGPEVIAQAAVLCPEADWHLLGTGPCSDEARRIGAGCDHIHFGPFPGYTKLPECMAASDIVLGAFSKSEKAGRVIPNKIYQGLACGRVILSRDPLPGAFPWEEDRSGMKTGVITVPPGDPQALADAVRRLTVNAETLPALGRAARETFDRFGSFSYVSQALQDVIDRLSLKQRSSA